MGVVGMDEGWEQVVVGESSQAPEDASQQHYVWTGMIGFDRPPVRIRRHTLQDVSYLCPCH